MRVWRAAPRDADSVARLLAEFRDWWNKDVPTSEQIRETVDVLLRDEATEFLLGAVGDGEPAGVCQLRYRLSVWTSAPDCWFEDLYVEPEA